MSESENNTNKNVFSARLNMLLSENNIAQRELAEIVGVTEVSMSRYVRGERIPHEPIVANIARYFGVTGEYLLGITDVRPQKTDMTLDQYQKFAARTINQRLDHDEIEMHSLFGMCAEVGELQGLYQKYYQGHVIKIDHVKKELGDILWMIAEYCTANKWNLGDIAQLNIDKLRERYPDGFDVEHSLHRAEGDV